MNKEKLKLMMKIAQSNPNLQIEHLIELVSIEDSPAKQKEVVQVDDSKKIALSQSSGKMDNRRFKHSDIYVQQWIRNKKNDGQFR